MKALLLALGLFLAFTAQAAPPTAAPAAKKALVPDAFRLKKGALVEIGPYSSASDTFEIVIKKEPGVGPNIATPEALIQALGLDISAAAFKKAKNDYIGSEFTLTRELPLLKMSEIEQRKKHSR